MVSTVQAFHQRYPHLKVIFEPGSAFAWQTGPLVSHVVDIVEDKGIKTAILDVSFTCHMPDCLEMPYNPEVRGAEHVDEETGENVYRLGGNDMIHYTTVKTNMFNGISHPAIGILHTDGQLEILRQYGYEDYRDRMD